MSQHLKINAILCYLKKIANKINHTVISTDIKSIWQCKTYWIQFASYNNVDILNVWVQNKDIHSHSIYNIAVEVVVTIIRKQFSSVSQSCWTLCDPMDCSMPRFPVHHQLQEFTQTHVYWVGEAIQASHPLLSPSPPAFNLSQHQDLFQ